MAVDISFTRTAAAQTNTFRSEALTNDSGGILTDPDTIVVTMGAHNASVIVWLDDITFTVSEVIQADVFLTDQIITVPAATAGQFPAGDVAFLSQDDGKIEVVTITSNNGNDQITLNDLPCNTFTLTQNATLTLAGTMNFSGTQGEDANPWNQDEILTPIRRDFDNLKIRCGITWARGSTLTLSSFDMTSTAIAVTDSVDMDVLKEMDNKAVRSISLVIASGSGVQNAGGFKIDADDQVLTAAYYQPSIVADQIRFNHDDFHPVQAFARVTNHSVNGNIDIDYSIDMCGMRADVLTPGVTPEVQVRRGTAHRFLAELQNGGANTWLVSDATVSLGPYTVTAVNQVTDTVTLSGPASGTGWSDRDRLTIQKASTITVTGNGDFYLDSGDPMVHWDNTNQTSGTFDYQIFHHTRGYIGQVLSRQPHAYGTEPIPRHRGSEIGIIGCQLAMDTTDTETHLELTRLAGGQTFRGDNGIVKTSSLFPSAQTHGLINRFGSPIWWGHWTRDADTGAEDAWEYLAATEHARDLVGIYNGSVGTIDSFKPNGFSGRSTLEGIGTGVFLKCNSQGRNLYRQAITGTMIQKDVYSAGRDGACIQVNEPTPPFALDQFDFTESGGRCVNLLGTTPTPVTDPNYIHRLKGNGPLTNRFTLGNNTNIKTGVMVDCRLHQIQCNRTTSANPKVLITARSVVFTVCDAAGLPLENYTVTIRRVDGSLADTEDGVYTYPVTTDVFGQTLVNGNPLVVHSVIYDRQIGGAGTVLWQIGQRTGLPAAVVVTDYNPHTIEVAAPNGRSFTIPGFTIPEVSSDLSGLRSFIVVTDKGGFFKPDWGSGFI